MSFVTRFAPSPTGPLHLGHAYSALLAHDMARAENGTFLLRIEDIDQTRARPDWEAQIFDDLRWLGIDWDGPVLRQSENLDTYGRALDALWRRSLIYPCTCTRADIKAAVSAPQEGVPTHGPDGLIYPGTCNTMSMARRFPEDHPRPKDDSLRLDMALATLAAPFQARIDGPDGASAVLYFMETGAGPSGETGTIEVTPAALERAVGDIVLARRDMATSYHLSVVLDDAAQAITHVVRGQDLFDATQIHVLLQALLGLPTPIYHHHRLIRDAAGKRLAKRDDARAIAKYRAEGATPQDIRAMVGL